MKSNLLWSRVESQPTLGREINPNLTLGRDVESQPTLVGENPNLLWSRVESQPTLVGIESQPTLVSRGIAIYLHRMLFNSFGVRDLVRK